MSGKPPRTSKKRAAAAEPMQEDSSSSSGGGVSDDGDQKMEEEEIITSPSLGAKQGMRMRSGKRKRRRSKETSGLTPPDRANKKTKVKATEKPKTDSEEEDSEEEEAEEPPRKNGRASYMPDAQALAEAQDPEMTPATDREGAASSPDTADANRRLFDSKPPPMQNTSAVERVGEVWNSGVKSLSHALRLHPQSTKKSPTIPQHEAPKETVIPAKGEQPQEESSSMDPSSTFPFRILFMVLLSLAFFSIWPFCVHLADKIIPLNELSLKTKVVEEIEEVIIEVEEGTDEVALEGIKALILEGLERLETLKTETEESQQAIHAVYGDLSDFLGTIKMKIGTRENYVETRSKRLEEAEMALNTALEESDLSSDSWHDARQAANAVGGMLIDMASLDIWEVPEPGDCSGVAAVVDPEEKSNQVLEPGLLEDEFENLLQRARKSANKIINSEDSEQRVREWLQIQIEKSLKGNKLASKMMADLASSSGGGEMGDMEEVKEAIMERLEMERADRTGQYDHASIVNGAKVIYGGKRGTSKSLVDYLPLYNRIMQLVQLRFYGFGPEAAISPTYPPDALGQCWSFQQIPLKEQLKRRRAMSTGGSDDDYKRGNFGTLTISLPKPVKVESVIIEHPPQGVTHQINSAIKAFRIIGYADPMATGKSWSLGSFAYDISK